MTLSLFGLPVQAYGLCLAGAGAAALLLAAYYWKKAGIKPGALSWFSMLAIPLMVLFGRLAYCLADYEWVSMEGFSFVFDFSRGGYMLYGALLGGMLALGITSKIANVSFSKMADNLAVPALVLVALGRLAIGLTTGQDYGWSIEDWFMEDNGMSLFVWEDPSILYRLPFGIQDYYGYSHWAVFVFEALVAGGLAVMAARAKVGRDGGRAVLALVGYAAMQALCESLRQDAVLRFGFVRINQVLGGVIVLALLILCYLRTSPKAPRKMALCTAGTVLCAAVVIAMEFALEKKISAIEWMPMDVCYLIMAAACVTMIYIVRRLWRDAYGKKEAL